VLDLWQAKSANAMPLIVFIHGGEFTAGNKEQFRGSKMIAQHAHGESTLRRSEQMSICGG
tara:strand:- start:15 stop:194 length:180 start_codon:yes stop_codon:yes gene_type:complete